jgi:hypothetical protein
MRTIYLPVGLPAAGKSTLGHALQLIYQRYNLGPLHVFGPDVVREQMYPGYDAGLVPFKKINNRQVFDRAYARGRRLLKTGDLWWDAVNTHSALRETARDGLMNFAKSSPGWENTDGDLPGAYLHNRIVAIDIRVPFSIIVERNRTCREGHRCPPLETLKMFSDQKKEWPVRAWDPADPFPLETIIDQVWTVRWEKRGETRLWTTKTNDAWCRRMIERANGIIPPPWGTIQTYIIGGIPPPGDPAGAGGAESCLTTP